VEDEEVEQADAMEADEVVVGEEEVKEGGTEDDEMEVAPA